MRHLSGRWSKLMLHEKIKTGEVFMYPLPISALKKINVSHLHCPIYHLFKPLNKIDIKSMCCLSNIRSFTYTILILLKCLSDKSYLVGPCSVHLSLIISLIHPFCNQGGLFVILCWNLAKRILHPS